MSYSRRIALLVWFSFFAFGIFEAVLPAHGNVSSLVHGLILIFGAVFWCSYHAEENELNIPKGSIILCVLLPILGIPYYLVRGFGFKNGGLKLFGFFLFITISIITYVIPLELIGLVSTLDRTRAPAA